MPESQLLRVLTRGDVIALSFGAMIGWSWVLLTGEWLLRAGTAGTLIAFAVGGIAVLLISLTYAELAAALPKAGGEHVYTHRALGPGASFICTWSLIMAYLTVPAFESAAVPTALEYLFPEMRAIWLWRILDADVHLSLAGCGVIATLIITWVNYRGIKPAAFVQMIVTGMFCLVGVLFFTGALLYPGSALETGTGAAWFNNGWLGFLGVLIMVPALMVGFDVIPQSAEEINLEPRLIGSLLVASVAMAVLWYGLISLSVGLSLTEEQLSRTTMATADAMANVWQSPMAGNLMVIAGVGGILTSWNAFVVGASRVIYAFALSGMLPAIFTRLHPRYKTPYAAILFIGLICCISPFFGRTILVWLIDAGSFAIVIAYGFVAWAFLALRTREPDLPRPFRVRHGRVVGFLALLMSICLGLVYLPGSPSALIWPYEWAMVGAWAMLGTILYLSRRRYIHSGPTRNGQA